MQYIQNNVLTESMNKVLINTYRLLAVTLLFSGIMTYISISINAPHPGMIITLVGFYGLLFLVNKFQNSSYGILALFALTGFMGFTLGPIINFYLSTSNGSAIVMQSLVGTGVIFLTLSFYAITTKKDFSFMGGMLLVGVVTVIIAIVANIFLQIPALSLTISAVIILLMSGFILHQTSNIIHNGEANYITAAASLFVSIYNIFISLLQILGFAGED